MKVIYPKKKKKRRVEIDKKRVYLVVFLLAVGIFFSVIFFNRSGYASTIFAKMSNVPEADIETFVIEGIDEVADEIKTEIKLYEANGLPTIFLDIPFDSMLKIEEKRVEALAVGILLSSDDDYVPANMHYNDEQNLDIKIRLKGDLTDHLEGDKWSFRIHITENDGTILGMRRFSLQAPETRNYVYEWGYHQNLFMENILTTRYSFVNVVVNGVHKGIYALEESFTEDLLESQERREGVIIRIDEDFFWENRALFSNDEKIEKSAEGVGYFWVANGLSSEIISFRDNHISNNDVLSEELKTATELLYSFSQGELPAEEVFDEELWGRYYAITDLWAAGHGAHWNNVRFYYNPVTGLLEPVAFDGLVLESDYNKARLAYPLSSEPLFNSVGVQKAYIETLERIATPEYIHMLKEKFGDEFGEYVSRLEQEYQDNKLSPPPLLRLPWDDLNFRQDMLSRNLNSAQPIRGNYHFVEENGATHLRLDLVNLMVVPVEITEIILDGTSQPFERAWCVNEFCQTAIVANTAEIIMLSGKKSNFVSVPFLIPAENFETKEEKEEKIFLRVNLYGGTETFEIPIYANYVPQGMDAGAKPSVTLEETLNSHPFLIEIGDHELAIETGDWFVSGDLVLPDGYNLIIPEGVTLRFEEENLFLVYGKIDIRGTEEAPVLLTAQSENWGGMVVLGAPETSTWRYVVAEKMAGISRAGWILTGGITFYESPVNISHSIIGNNATEDALNIIRTSFSFEYVEFLNTPSDAFDGDFTTGTATHCSFHDIQGDAFDVSGTSATITNSYFTNIGDKAISAGEKSDINLSNIVIRNVGIGIASKDLSTVSINTSSIHTARVVGLASYIKKPQYGPAFIEATNIEILNTERPAICQTDNELLLNGESIRPEDVDVDSLYDQGILGN